jgi:hypothetical protein
MLSFAACFRVVFQVVFFMVFLQFSATSGCPWGCHFGCFLKSVGFVVKRGTLDSEQPVQRFCMILGVRASPKDIKNHKNDFWNLVCFLLWKSMNPKLFFLDFSKILGVILEPRGAPK